MRLSILSLGVYLLALPAALAQAPPPAPVPYPLNVKPSTPQATLTGVPAQPATPQTFYVEGQGGLRIYMPPAPPILPPAQSYPTGTTMPWMAVVASTKPKTRVFEVADLVHAPLQIPGAAALENIKGTSAHTLMKLIVAMAKPDTWERHGGAGKIEFIAASDCLCVTNSPEAIAEVTKVLDGLRRMQDQQVSVEVKLFTVPSGFGAKAGWPTADDKGIGAPKYYTPEEMKKAAVEMKADQRVGMIARPTLTLTDGQTGFFSVGNAGSVAVVPPPPKSDAPIQTLAHFDNGQRTAMRCTPTVSVDGKSVQLRMETSHIASGGPGNTGGMGFKHDSIIMLPCEHSSIVYLGKQSVEERTETRIPALSNLPYLDRLFRNQGVRTVEQNVYQIVTVRLFKEAVVAAPVKPSAREVGTVPPAPCCKPSCGIELN